jgi:hypothetical protein
MDLVSKRNAVMSSKQLTQAQKSEKAQMINSELDRINAKLAKLYFSDRPALAEKYFNRFSHAIAGKVPDSTKYSRDGTPSFVCINKDGDVVYSRDTNGAGVKSLKRFYHHSMHLEDAATLPVIKRTTRVSYENKRFAELSIVHSHPKVSHFIYSKQKQTNKYYDGIERMEYTFKGGSTLFKDQPKLVDLLLSSNERSAIQKNRKELLDGARENTVYHNELEVQTLLGLLYRYNNIRKCGLNSEQLKYVANLKDRIDNKLSGLNYEQMDNLLRSKVYASRPNSLINFKPNHSAMAPPMMLSRIVRFGDYHAMSPKARELNPLPESRKGERINNWQYLDKDPNFYLKHFGFNEIKFVRHKYSPNVIFVTPTTTKGDHVVKEFHKSARSFFIREEPFDFCNQSYVGSGYAHVQKYDFASSPEEDLLFSNLLDVERNYTRKHESRLSDKQIARILADGNYHGFSSAKGMIGTVWQDSIYNNILSPDFWRTRGVINRYKSYRDNILDGNRDTLRNHIVNEYK